MPLKDGNMIKILIRNRKSTLKHAPLSVIRKLEKKTSYLTMGYYFAPSYRSKRWDGRLHLLKYSKKHGYRFPTGLLKDVERCLKKHGIQYKLNDKRIKPTAFVEYGWDSSVVLRDYQNRCVNKTTRKGIYRGRGIVRSPIRSGKTKIMAGIIYRLKVRALIIVPSKLLLWQTHEELKNTLQTDVGVIGDEKWFEENVTVATAQSLVSASGKTVEETYTDKKGKEKTRKKKIPPRKEFVNISDRYDLVIFDECHHLTASGWHDIVQKLDTYYKIGLSATALLKNTREQEKGVIWLKACCGNVKCTVETSELIEKGYLIRPEITFYEIRNPDLIGKSWNKELQNSAIYENKFRNNKIVKLTRKYVLQGKKVAILSNRLNQISILSELLDEYNLPTATLTGSTRTEDRKEFIEEYVQGRFDVLLGTVLSEGVDIPEIDVVVVAEGGKDAKKTIQRMRNLTFKEGKKKAIVIEFADLTNHYFAEHSLERLKTYREESEFEVRYIKSR
jgi:superfamily II DNA or RNA helicase